MTLGTWQKQNRSYRKDILILRIHIISEVSGSRRHKQAQEEAQCQLGQSRSHWWQQTEGPEPGLASTRSKTAH